MDMLDCAKKLIEVQLESVIVTHTNGFEKESQEYLKNNRDQRDLKALHISLPVTDIGHSSVVAPLCR